MCGLCFPRVFIHHSPNGAYLGSAKAIRGGASKGDGTKAGWPDLICMWAGKGGAFIEVKRPKTGVMSPAQKAMRDTLHGLGWPVAVVTSIDEAFVFLRSCGAPWSGVEI